MARVLTKCPECGQKISNRFECRNCGLLFNRYFEAQARKKKAEKERAALRSRNILILNTTISALLVICLIGGGFYLWMSKTEEVAAPSVPPAARPIASVPETAPEQPAPETTPQRPDNPVDIVVNATVVVQSPWGVSTGFFIAEDKLLTTKKTVFYDEQRLAQETEQLQKDRAWLDEEPNKIKRLKERFDTEGDPEKKAELAERIAKREQRLEQRTLKYQESEAVVARLTEDLKTVTIDILTIDGRIFHMAYMDTSATYDLALLTVYSTGIIPVKIADRPLEENETIYTIGKNKTSIKGTFTGYSDEGLLQSDVPIIPAYSGGPLANDKGMVFGVSVMPPKEQRRKGIAVPIATVLQEFGI